ncbi:PP2C family protein-serine/threonine phosphatase [Brevibacillus massiliensis]|uniref:PP2C family protein-serine/threonine phosphatase n=1 Tax=Brevibacillus massiliensis TaxID=1118054 RepID=UPI0002E11431|nr:PP2C family protein-serine/threonine phosphatase [Brevibacillus massiliensis]
MEAEQPSAAAQRDRMEGVEVVVWQTMLYAFSLFVSLYVLLASRLTGAGSCRYGYGFLLGGAFFFWGLGGLLSPDSPSSRMIVPFLSNGLAYAFALLALRRYPLLPSSYFDRWKSACDVGLLILLHFAFGDDVLPRLFLAVSGIAVLVFARRKHGLREYSLLSLAGTILFWLILAQGPWLPGPLLFFLGAASLVAVCAGLGKQSAQPGQECGCDVSRHTHEQILVYSHYQGLVFFYSAIAVFGVLVYPPDAIRNWGLGLYTVLLTFRWLILQHEKRGVLEQSFQFTRNLERHFETNLAQIRKKNEDLSRVLKLKQSYEELLMKSNEHTMQPISYENLHQKIEQIVDVWYMTMIGMRFLRVSLQSERGEIYYQTERGSQPERYKEGYVLVRLIVDKERDTPLSPRYVAVEALTDESTEEVRSFYQLLAIYVSRLIMRCLQEQQSLGLRLMEQEMELASRIQFSLIPKNRLVLPDVQAKAVYIPAAYIGGDYVDYFSINERYTCFLIADISGHGIPASLLTTGIRNSFRAVVQMCTSPDEMLVRLNHLLYEDLSETRSYITMLIAVFDHQEMVLRISRAGHPAPFYLSGTKQIHLTCARGMGLGLSLAAEYPLDEWKVEEDFTLLLYTDGLINLGRGRQIPDSEKWLKLLGRVIKADQAREKDRIALLEREIWKKTRQQQQNDDISVLILDVKAPGKGERGGIEDVSV